MFANRSDLRRGITVVEIIVVIAIIGILGMLLLPAVQSAREASRRITCVGHLKQIGLAMVNYQTSHEVFPQGANGGPFSAHIMLLPFLEQASLYNSVNFNGRDPLGGFAHGWYNATIATTRLEVYCCPADPDLKQQPLTSYAWNGGIGIQRSNFVGPFGARSTRHLQYLKPSDISDGLSSTAAMTEWKIGHDNTSDDSTVVFKVDVEFNATYDEFVSACQNSNRDNTEFGMWTKPAEWTSGMYGSTLANFNSLPNSLSCLFSSSIDMGNWPASSYHQNNVNVLFLDGHVRSFGQDLSLKMWRSISTRAGGEVVDVK